ncbi:ABC transporter substrate-binding protein [Halobacteria archaeon AArc-curdl1]|uniref:ABC transporter substrate-binding protein n=1 Tax=Natronosalvus hydrolyticus TaxID=2979988 RepID=A0AAP2Z626_9EURY|nr:ABC transporter substrate-binding protein [Halobacteria archaeon AArc-curdl1]
MAIDNDVNRRQFLRASGAGAAVGATMLAGCMGGGDDDGNGGNGGNGGDDDITVDDDDQTTSEAEDIERGGTLVVGLSQDPRTLNPHLGDDSGTSAIADQIANRLVRTDQTGEIIPDLARDWQVNDELTEYTFQLHEGVQFHGDYGEADAEAVVDNFHKIILDEEYGAFAASDYEGTLFTVDDDGNIQDHPEDTVYASGDYEVTFDMLEADASFLFALADYRSSILPVDAIDEHGDDFGSTSEGTWATGAFQFVEGQDNSHYELEANPDYFKETDAGQLPYLDGVRYEIIVESSVRNTQVQTGEIHLDHQVTASDVDGLQDADDVEVRTRAGTDQSNLYVNTRNFEPFTDVRVRQALSHAVNREAIVEVQWDGLAEPAYNIFPEWHWAYDEDAVTRYEHDVERAQELLDEAGHSNLEFTARVTNESQFTDHATILQQNLAQAGIDMNIETMEKWTAWGPFLPDSWDNDPVGPPEDDHALVESIGYGFDADMYAYLTYYTGEFFNSSFYSDEQVDEWLDETRRVADQERREELYSNVQEQVTEEIPQIYTIWQNRTHAIREEVNDYILRPNGMPAFEEIWLTQE